MVGVPSFLGPIRQMAFVVDDIEASAAQWAQRHGIGPWFVFDVDFPDTEYRGRRVPMRARMALAQSGGQQIELIQPDRSLPSLYTEFIDRGGAGVHHVCYWCDLDVAWQHFSAFGAEMVQRGTTGNGGRFMYLTGTTGLAYLEFVEVNAAMAAFFDVVAAAAQGWDGTDPVRVR
jgi:hypothetical protein